MEYSRSQAAAETGSAQQQGLPHPGARKSPRAGRTQCSVLLLTGATGADLDAAVLHLASGKHGVMALRYWVEADPAEYGSLRVTRSLCAEREIPVQDARGRVPVVMDGCCLTCTVKHDVGLLLGECAQQCEHLLVVLPPGMEAAPVASYLEDSCALDRAFLTIADDFSEGDECGEVACPQGESLEYVSVGGIVTVVRHGGLQDRLFDDAPFMIAEATSAQDAHGGSCDAVYESAVEDPMDDRSLGGVTANLLHEADHVLLCDWTPGADRAVEDVGQGASAHAPGPEDAAQEGAADAEDAADPIIDLLRALMPGGAVIHDDISRVDIAELAQAVASVGNPDELDGEVLQFKAFGRDVVALGLRTRRLLHPGRLSEFLAGDHQAMHIQAHFRVPTKPFSTFVWECEPNGSQIEQIPDGQLDGDIAATELFMLASCEDARSDGAELTRMVEGLLLTAEETGRGTVEWMGQDDVFTRWAEGGPADIDGE